MRATSSGSPKILTYCINIAYVYDSLCQGIEPFHFPVVINTILLSGLCNIWDLETLNFMNRNESNHIIIIAPAAYDPGYGPMISIINFCFY